jgi:hydroxymethylbilane synthase
VKRIIRVGSRESALAVVQARLVIDAITRVHPGIEIELVTMKTFGDLHQAPFQRLIESGEPGGAKGLFMKELEQALREERIDLAVHSLKDVPMEHEEDLPIVALWGRSDPRDALVLPPGTSEPGEGPAGCSSARRRIQLLELMPERRVEPIRGNIVTRLKKLDEGPFAFLVLAAAGLLRLGLENRISRFFTPEEMLPAAGQGVLACQGRRGAEYDFLGALDDPDVTDCAAAERAFAKQLGGGCTLPVGALAEVHGTELRLAGFCADEKRGICRRGRIAGDRKNAVGLGETLARQLGEE